MVDRGEHREGAPGPVAPVEPRAARARCTPGCPGGADVAFRGVATGSAIAAAIALGLAGILQANALNADQTARWTHARAASEALKAETYRYLLRVAPYAGAGRAQVLQAQMELVQGRTKALVADQQEAKPDDRPLPTLRTVQEYATVRAQGQATWHRDKVVEHERQARN